MAVTVIADVGGATSNSNCSLERARAYYATNYYATDANLSDDDKLGQALITATRLMDQGMLWNGVVANATQALLWPRFGAEKLNGYFFDQHTMPPELLDATAEFARQLLQADRTADSDLQVQGITHLKAGSVELAFQNPTTKVIPDAVYWMVRHLGRPRTESGNARVQRC